MVMFLDFFSEVNLNQTSFDVALERAGAAMSVNCPFCDADHMDFERHKKSCFIKMAMENMVGHSIVHTTESLMESWNSRVGNKCLHPISSEKDYQAALRMIEASMAIEGSNSEELEVLAILVQEYEKSTFPVDLPDPVLAIKFRMEQLGLTKEDLITYFGDLEVVNHVFNYSKSLDIDMIRNIQKGIGVPLECLIKCYPLKPVGMEN